MTIRNYILHNTEGDITPLNRMMRAVTALVMLGYPMFVETSPLGIIALLPLVAIYPMFTAVVGWDPLLFIIETSRAHGRAIQLRLTSRFVLLLAGTVMIMLVLIQSGEMGWYALLALGSIVPIFVAILGEDPIEALFESDKELHRLQDQSRNAFPPSTVDNLAIDKSANSANTLSKQNTCKSVRRAA